VDVIEREQTVKEVTEMLYFTYLVRTSKAPLNGTDPHRNLYGGCRLRDNHACKI